MLMLNIAPDVARLLGSEDAIGKVFHTAESGYCCPVCGDSGRLTEDESASVLLVLRGPTATPVVRLAHGCCADSAVLVSAEPLTTDTGMDVPGKAWLRPHPDTPRAVLLLGPRLTAVRVTEGGETIDQLSAGLLGHGFGLLTNPDAPMRDVDGLTIRLDRGGRLLVYDARDACLWDGALVLPPGWGDAARTAGRVGVVVAAGLNLYDPDRDHLYDLFAAIGDGAVVAGAGRLLTEPLSDPQPD